MYADRIDRLPVTLQLLVAAHGGHVPAADRRIFAGREQVLVLVELELGYGALVLDQIAHLLRFLQVDQIADLIAGAGDQEAVRRTGDRLHAAVVCMVRELLEELHLVLCDD